MKNVISLTCYVDSFGYLTTYATAECLRKATAAEKRESGYGDGDAAHTGCFTAHVSQRTLKARAPKTYSKFGGSI